MQKQNLEQQARAKGISVAQLKIQRVNARAEKAAREATLAEMKSRRGGTLGQGQRRGTN